MNSIDQMRNIYPSKQKYSKNGKWNNFSDSSDRKLRKSLIVQQEDPRNSVQEVGGIKNNEIGMYVGRSKQRKIGLIFF
jgi:hypothetical protein